MKRLRHYKAGPVTSRRGVPMLLGLTLLAPALLIIAVYSVVLGYEYYSAGFSGPETAEINEKIRGAQIYDRNGVFLYEYIDEDEGVRFPISLGEVSTEMIAATIATEDYSFYNNPGVNPRGLARAAWENLSPVFSNGTDAALEGSGGSSITQQLVKNIYIDPEDRYQRSIDRKIREAAYALELTTVTEKDQILEWYFNLISYGSIYNGIESAAQGYFGKPASELTLAESALLAGIPQSPALYDPINRPEAALARRNQVLDLIGRQEHIQVKEETEENAFFTVTPEEIEAAKEEPLGVEAPTYTVQAPHFVFSHVAPEIEARFGRDALLRDGLIVTTTLDLELQNQTMDYLEQWIREFEDISNSRNGAVMVMDNRTGEVLVMIGSRNYYDEVIDGNVDNLTALNSPGSSFKPFIFLTSFMELDWGPHTMIEDTPVTYRESDGSVFRPENPTVGSYHGNITIGSALGNSLNIPPFKAVIEMGVEPVVETAKRVGFTTLEGQYGPSIAIGGVDLTAYDLTYGYSVLANNGVMVGVDSTIDRGDGKRSMDPAIILRVEDEDGNVLWDLEEERKREQVVPPEQAYLITSILTNPQNMCITFGCGGVSIPGRTAGVKTGTSSPYDPDGPHGGLIGETWAFGYTPHYVVGVWAGNSDNEPITNIFSTSISFRVMRDTLEAAHRGEPSPPFTRPDNIEERVVCSGGGFNGGPGGGSPNNGSSGGPNCRTELVIRGEGVSDEGTVTVTPTPDADASPTPSSASPTPTQTQGPGPTPTPPPTQTPVPLGSGPSQGGGGGQQQANTDPAQPTQAIVTLPGSVHHGNVNIQGWAWSQQMQSYRLEYSSAVNPGSWVTIGEWYSPVRGGQLGVWQTGSLPSGTYNLRVVVDDAGGAGATSSVVQVQVGG